MGRRGFFASIGLGALAAKLSGKGSAKAAPAEWTRDGWREPAGSPSWSWTEGSGTTSNQAYVHIGFALNSAWLGGSVTVALSHQGYPFGTWSNRVASFQAGAPVQTGDVVRLDGAGRVVTAIPRESA